MRPRYKSFSRRGLTGVAKRDQANQTLVSTARITFLEMGSDPFLQLLQAFPFGCFRSEQRPMDIFRAEAAYSLNHNPATLFFPL